MYLKFKVYLFVFLLLFNYSNGQILPDVNSTEVNVKIRVKDDAGVSSFKEWKTMKTVTLHSLIDLNLKKSDSTDEYGGLISITYKSTGFFYTKRHNNKWQIIDPLGHPFYFVAIQSVNPGKSDRNKKSFDSIFHSNDKWIVDTKELLLKNYFYSIGAWSNISYCQKSNFNYSLLLNIMSSYGKIHGGTHPVAGHIAYPENTIFVFDKAFATFCDTFCKKLYANKSDKRLIGYFTDNELPFSKENLLNYLRLKDTNDEGYIAAKLWLKKNHITDTSLVTDDIKESFLSFQADTYFKIVTNAIRKYDPNHLILGSRFYHHEKKSKLFFETVGKYLDVVSINYYGSWTASQKWLYNWSQWSNKPILISEFYVKGDDVGLTNLSGAGWLVPTQADRGKFYQHFCLGLLQSDVCVGWNWLRYQDNDPTDKHAELSNQDANKGIVDNLYKPYDNLLNYMREFNSHIFSIKEYLDKRRVFEIIHNDE